MGAGRIYWGQIIAVLGVMMCGAQAATQWTAARLAYQPALGAPDFFLFGMAIYAPWRLFIWWFQYDHYARPIFETGGAIMLTGAVLSVATAFGFSLWRSRDEKRSRTYGTARWADAKDIDRHDLSDGDGVILGTWRGKLLRHDGDEHVLVIAPTNTGKSVGVSLPTGLIWRESYIALDLKGENWRITSGVRATFGPIYRFAPTEKTTHRYNPLTQVRRGEAEVRDAHVLADMLVDPEGSLRERSHWQLRGFELLVSIILWTLYAEEKKTLARIAELLAEAHRERPIVSAELPPRGERFEGVLPPVSRAPCFSIRKPAQVLFRLADYVAAGMMSAGHKSALEDAIGTHANILIAGGTGSGKTTLANALLAEIAALDERVVILEDTRELVCAAQDVVALRTRAGVVSLSDLVRSTLRLRPDRIIVGEVRGPEALDLLKAWNTGHPGGIATIHANSARAALSRLEQLCMEVCERPPTALIEEAIDLVVFIARGGAAGRVVADILAPKATSIPGRTA